MIPPQKHAKPKRPSGFTLIELLVVISIVSLLIAILLPALAKAKFTARQVKCLSGLRHLGIANYAYLADNNFFYPYAFHIAPPGEPRIKYRDKIAGYTSDIRSIAQCPNSPWPGNDVFFWQYSTNPAIMEEHKGSHRRPAMRHDDIGRDSEVIVLMDGVPESEDKPQAADFAKFLDLSPVGSAYDPAALDNQLPFNPWGLGTNVDGWVGSVNKHDVRWRESGAYANRGHWAANFLFADGHVENLTPLTAVRAMARPDFVPAVP